jgi:hypothetical protein
VEQLVEQSALEAAAFAVCSGNQTGSCANFGAPSCSA